MKAKDLTLEQMHGAICMAIDSYQEYFHKLDPEQFVRPIIKKHVDGFIITIQWCIEQTEDESICTSDFFVLNNESTLIDAERLVNKILDEVNTMEVVMSNKTDY